MKAAVVTGSTSFLGAHLCIAFAEAGWRVVAARSKPDAFYDGIQAARLAKIAGITTPAVFDITDAKAVADAAARHDPHLWLHHAGYVVGHAGNDFDLGKGMAVNVGSVPVLYKALEGSGAGVIVTGSEAEYPPLNSPLCEDVAGTPRSPYGLSKFAETLASEQFSEIAGVPTRVARIFLPVGNMDHPGKLMPQVVKALRAGEAMGLSPCTQRRDLISVADVGRIYLALAEDIRTKGGFGIYNAGTGTAPPLADALIALADILGADRALLKFGAHSMRPGEPDTIVADSTKLTCGLGIVPATDLKEIVGRIVETA